MILKLRVAASSRAKGSACGTGKGSIRRAAAWAEAMISGCWQETAHLVTIKFADALEGSIWSLEVSVPVIKDYPVYNFRTVMRVNMQF
jgi:hypothetical protein